MRSGMSQHTQMKQEIKINPRLYQAMDLLYMPLLDLQQHLKQELLNNPFLEMYEEDEDEDGEESTTEEGQTEEEQQKEETTDEIDWEEILLNGFDAGGRPEEHEEKEYFEPVTVDRRDLSDHLRDQVQLLDLDERQHAARRGVRRQHQRRRLPRVLARRDSSRHQRVGRESRRRARAATPRISRSIPRPSARRCCA